MKWFSNGLNIVELSLINDKLDFNDFALIKFLLDFMNSNKLDNITKKNGDIYYWIYYPTIIKELPSLQIRTAKGLRDRLKKYMNCGLIEHETLHERKAKGRIIRGTFAYYRFTKKIKTILEPQSEEEMIKKEKIILEKIFPKIPANLEVPMVETSRFVSSEPPGSNKDTKIKDTKIKEEEIYNSDELCKAPILNSKNLQEENKNIFPARIELKDFTLKAARMLKKYFSVRIPKPGQIPTKTLLRLQEHMEKLMDVNPDIFFLNKLEDKWRFKYNIQCNEKWKNNPDELIKSMEIAAISYQELKKADTWPENKKYLTDNIAIWIFSEKNKKSWFLYCLYVKPKKLIDLQTEIDKIKNTIFPDTHNGEIEKRVAEKFRLSTWDERRYWENIREIYDWWKIRDEVIREANSYRHGGIEGLDGLLEKMKQFRDSWQKSWNIGNFKLHSKTWKLFENWMDEELSYPINFTIGYIYKLALRIQRKDNIKISYFSQLEEEALKEEERITDIREKRIERALIEMTEEAFV